MHFDHIQETFRDIRQGSDRRDKRHRLSLLMVICSFFVASPTMCQTSEGHNPASEGAPPSNDRFLLFQPPASLTLTEPPIEKFKYLQSQRDSVAAPAQEPFYPDGLFSPHEEADEETSEYAAASTFSTQNRSKRDTCSHSPSKLLCLPPWYSKFELPFTDSVNVVEIGIDISDVLGINDKVTGTSS